MSTEAPPASAPATKKSMKVVLLATVIIGGIVIGGGAGAFMAGPLLAGGAAASHTAPADGDAKDGDSTGDHAAKESGDHGAEGEEGGKHAPTVIHLVENMVLNPANSGGSRFLLLSVAFAVKDEAAVTLLKERDPELRDAVIRFFGARNVDELGDITLRDSLKIQLRDVLGERFGGSTVRDVYFPQFVIQ